MSEEVRLLEIIAQKDAQIRQLLADKEQMSQELKLLKEKVDLLIRRIFGAKSEKLDIAQLELLFKEDALSGKADASAEKAEATPIVENLKPATKPKNGNGFGFAPVRSGLVSFSIRVESFSGIDSSR